MPYPRTQGGGGAGFTVGPPNNIFGTASANISTRPFTLTPAANRAAAETIRDNYFTANPSNLAQYDAEGNEALGVYLFFSDSGDLMTVGQTRVGGSWRDSVSVTGIPGLPGSGTDFSNISDNHIPAIGPGPDRLPFDSGLEMLSDGTIRTPASLRVGTNSIDLDLAHRMSSNGENVDFANLQSGVHYHPMWQTYDLGRDAGTFRHRFTETTLAINPDDSGTITNPDWTITVPAVNNPPEDGQTTRWAEVEVDATSVLTNVTLSIYIEGVKFIDIGPFDVTVGTYRFVYEPNFDFLVGANLRFSVTSPDGDVVFRANSAGTLPTVSTRVALWNDEAIGLQSESGEDNVQSDWNETDTNEDSFIQNKPTIPIARTDEEIRDVIGAMVTGNTETNIAVTYDDTNGKLDFSVAADANTEPTPSLHNLQVDIPSRVDLNTDLNVAHNLGFSVSNYAQLTALELIVTAGNNIGLTLPIAGGLQNQSVTLTGIVTSAQTTVTFQLSGTHAGGVVTSNIVTINVRDLAPEELTYVGFQADQLPVNFSAAGATSEEYQAMQTLAVPTFTGSQYVVIGQPQVENDITSIVIGGLDQFGTFTKVAGTATIGGAVYEFYYSNNLLLGSVVSGVQLTITRG